MPSAYDIAANQYDRPRKESSEGGSSQLRYSIHAAEILQFLVDHRLALASHIRRAIPHRFRTDRDARRHLQTLARVGELRILTYNDPRKPNVYVITDPGLDRARDFMPVIPESFPSRRDDSKGDHILHELMITEVAVSRAEFFRSRPDYEHLWDERFGFHRISAFANIIPDYADAYRSPQGCLIDFVEVLTGERSITKVKRKLQAYAEWAETDEAHDFLVRTYTYFKSEQPRPVFRINIGGSQPQPDRCRFRLGAADS